MINAASLLLPATYVPSSSNTAVTLKLAARVIGIADPTAFKQHDRTRL
jgi:hypothetical protein